MRQPRPPATLGDVKAAVDGLIRDAKNLQGEVNRLNNSLHDFNKRRALPPIDFTRVVDTSRGESFATYEPRSSTYESLRLDPRPIDTVEGLARLLRAVASDLEGAMRDIRAARLEIEGIGGSADGRDHLRQWRGKKR